MELAASEAALLLGGELTFVALEMKVCRADKAVIVSREPNDRCL